MVAIAGVQIMAKRRGRPESDRNDVAVRIDRALAMKGRSVAKDRGITLAEYFSEMIRPHVNKDYLAMLRKLDVDGDQGK